MPRVHFLFGFEGDLGGRLRKEGEDGKALQCVRNEKIEDRRKKEVEIGCGGL